MNNKNKEIHKTKQKHWTDEEVDYLKKWYGKKAIPLIAKKLNRTNNSVQTKIERLNLSRCTEFAGLLTAHKLAKLLNIDGHTVLLWIEKEGLPHK